ncbi:MAG TPA: CinA family nicotinamide mononucleotide deamidase-related protein [Gaiellaceae bacterium]
MASRLRSAIVASGSELVRGDRNDRNGPYLAGSLQRLGIDPVRITVVGDEPAELAEALRLGLQEDLLVVSGGLGPTHDDRTIELLAQAAGRTIAVDEGLAGEIEAFSRRIAERLKRPYADFADGVRKQAALPAGAEWVGLVGTAPAVVLDTGSCVAVALPGPPRELQELWPRVLETAPLRGLLERSHAPERRVLRLYGVSESAVAQALAAAGGEGDGVSVTICARDFEIHVDLFAEPGAEARAAALEAALAEANDRYVFSRDERSTAELVLELLRAGGQTLATAESCTGGLVAARLTEVPGSSDVFLGGIVAYSNDVKAAQLGVPQDVLAEHGAVSAETAAAMAVGARARLGAAVAVAVTGVAGPGGGTEEKPVGLVFLHAAGLGGELARRLDLPGDRATIRQRSAVAALHLVRRLVTQA